MIESAGQLFVLSGPSGVGKSSLRQSVLQILPELVYSISYTSRRPRKGETEGEDYHFVSLDNFLALKAAGEFVEWAQVHGNFYGTSRKQIERHLNGGRDVLLEIDVQGARQVKAYFPRASFIFVLPPDRDTLEKRLSMRGTEVEADMQARLDSASGELLEAVWYDYLIINDLLDKAVDALAAVIRSVRCKQQVVFPSVLNLVLPGGND